ncbi:hypothetical protein Cgig2_010809 [Carnegiea gigantea]|uniref:Uncharacterized protein n=1 Tax=Carnegiea gigantea TaxID=171969 RepID=A0A9Q1JQ35_9CARY|nr:hypothetical protein Cgig2_010809 [Carnegiea gigantea]
MKVQTHAPVDDVMKVQALCPSYELAVAEEAAEHFVLPELPQVWLYGNRILEARFRTKAELEESSGAGQQEEDSDVELEGEGSATEGAASPFDDDKQGSGITGEERRQRTLGMPISPFILAFPPLYDTREMTDYVRESFIWRWERATRLPHPLSKDCHILCPHFSLSKAKGAATDFELPEMVQATFYAMLVNVAVELGVVGGFMAEGLKSPFVGLRWSSFEAWMSCIDHELKEAQLRQWAVAVEVRGPSNGQEESPGSNGPPPPSSDEE